MLLAQMVNTVTAINMVPIMQQVEKEHLKWKKEIKILHDYNKKKKQFTIPIKFYDYYDKLFSFNPSTCPNFYFILEDTKRKSQNPNKKNRHLYGKGGNLPLTLY